MSTELLPPAALATRLIEPSVHTGSRTYFENGALVIEGEPPKPLHHWAISVDRNDGRGNVFLGNQSAPVSNEPPRFMDYQELPETPTMWTYTIVPLDVDGHPVARTKVVAIVVWKGMPGAEITPGKATLPSCPKGAFRFASLADVDYETALAPADEPPVPEEDCSCC